jgi:Shugoshin N-terminal coiled-coil region
MARLNDPPAVATESMEALKRRFLRQNRDLAKTNSIQSVRIRCLESEISRLLADNLELREEILQLRNSLESCPLPSTAVDNLRERLENKLHEINNLVLELGELPRKKRSSKSLRKEPLQRPERIMDLEEDMMEGRLPTIKEDKQWPRLSLKYAILWKNL